MRDWALDVRSADAVSDDGRKQLPDALKELRRCAGTQFDGQYVEAFIGAIESGEVALLPRLATGI